MPVQKLLGKGLPIGVLARIFYRKAELRVLCRIANGRADEVEKLAHFVGYVFKDRVPLFNAVHWATFNDMGYPTNAQGEGVGPICWNCPIGITVYVANRPYIGLGVELRGQALCIRQMQGVRGVLPLHNLQNWPELLIRICMSFADAEGLKEVRVYKADQDVGFAFPAVEPRAGQSLPEAIRVHQDRMRRRYDRTAKELKFKKRERYYVWEVPSQAQSQ